MSLALCFEGATLKLQISEYHVGRSAAEKYVFQLCKKLNYKLPAQNAHLAVITITNPDKTTKICISKEIEFVRRNGKANTLQFIHDANDRFLNTPVSIGLMGDVAGIKAQIKSTYGEHSTTIQFPGVIEAPEVSFADDISFFRKEAVRCFNDEDLSGFSRSFRGFLQSGISLVECFMHRYNFHVKTMIPSTEEYANTAVLDSRKSFDERIDAWMVTFACHKMTELKNSKEYSKFKELKKQRNNIVHPSNPSVPYGAREVIRYLNYARDGVGGLLSELRKYTGHTENIGFIRQVKTQPSITIAKK